MCFRRMLRHFIEERHYFGMGTHLLLVCGVYAGFVQLLYPRLPLHWLPAWHAHVGVCVFIIVLCAWLQACCSNPGAITYETYETYRSNAYAFDSTLYYEKRVCRHTGLPKLARSKFCLQLGINVPRFSHYCHWIGNAVGEENYRTYLLFLVLHVIALSYATVASGLALKSVSDQKGLWKATYIMPDDSRMPASWFTVLQFLVNTESGIVSLLLLTSCLMPIACGFVFWHMFLIGRGMTANEFYKWREIYDYYSRMRRAHAAVSAQRRPGGKLDDALLQELALHEATLDDLGQDGGYQDSSSDSSDSRDSSGSSDSSDIDSDSISSSEASLSSDSVYEGTEEAGVDALVDGHKRYIDFNETDGVEMGCSNESDKGSRAEDTEGSDGEGSRTCSLNMDDTSQDSSSIDDEYDEIVVSEISPESPTTSSQSPSEYFSFKSGKELKCDIGRRSSVPPLSMKLSSTSRMRVTEIRNLVASAAGFSDPCYLPPLVTLVDPPAPPAKNAYNRGVIQNFSHFFFGRLETRKPKAD